ncbi:autotransporter outer membrane beta-barrel domain-containing protein [Helicobacter cholecystus]|uniref:autotransporter outer membrane beta-barrel domain-containing protein n=1 Tax=Helicobacter cholecystus TaxID=45498 RepID=UPI002738ACC9|nr:autotransporter outer membrane beta-barrel domain-containing protein [Helicobacter cholecystus]
MRLSPAITLSALLVGGMGYGVDWSITGTETKNINAQQVNGVELTGNGDLTVNSTGNSAIKDMKMFWLTNGASANFNVNNGNLSLDLELLNPNRVTNTINFDVKSNATLTLNTGKNGGAHGVFNGVNTTLSATIANGGVLDGLMSNDGVTTLQINKGGTLSGNVSQTGGSLDATIEGKLDGGISANKNVQQVRLWANKNQKVNTLSSNITGNITIQGGDLGGILKGTNLGGSYVQSGGTSDIAFHHSQFNGNTTLSDATTLIHFYATNLKSITATNGNTTINLKADQDTHMGGSTMEGYTGNGGNTTINLIENSSMQSASQTTGTLTIDSTNSDINGSVTGSNAATLNLLLSKSTLTGSLSNSGGDSFVHSTNSKINGSITQVKGSLKADLQTTTIGEKITQNGGTLHFLNALNSTISQGILLTGVAEGNFNPQINLNNTQITNGGFFVSQVVGRMNGMISNNSVINGGFDQTNRGQVSLQFNNSTLNGGVAVRDGGNIQGNMGQSSNYATVLSFANNSTLNGGVTSNNHSIWLDFDHSVENGNFTFTGGNAYIKGTGQSTLTGDLISQNTATTSLDLRNSTLIGDIRQNNGVQTLTILNQARIKGNIENNNTIVAFELRQGSELQGSYTQNNGFLEWILGGNAIVHQDVTLNNVQTTLSNGRAVDQIETFKGNFTQNGGVLSGNLGGLTLEGQFTQNGGTTNIIFRKADFKQETKINDATLSKITFDDESNLKTTTISNSKNPDNTFTLDHKTILEGNFILKDSKTTLGVKNASKITGSIISNDPDNDLNLDFGGAGNEIGGDLEIKDGNLNGEIAGTTIGGQIKLIDAQTHLHIVDSEVKGGIDITRGYTLLTLQNSTIGTGFTMSQMDGQGRNPTLGLSINEGSKIDGDLRFENTIVALGGFGDNNLITGNLISTNTTLYTGGDNFNQAGHNPTPTSISGLTIQGELKQEKGSLDLIFAHQSDIQGKSTFNNGIKSHLTLQNSKLGAFEIIKGQDNLIILKDASQQKGAIALTDTTATIKAFGQSVMEGDITVTTPAQTTPHTNIFLDQSTLKGNINQFGGTLNLEYINNSNMIGSITTGKIDPLSITLDRSSITGDMTIASSNVQINMSNQSLIEGDFALTNNSSFKLNANASVLKGDITHTFNNPQANVFEIELNFNNGSIFDNNKLSISGNMVVNSQDSTVNSTKGMDLISGIFNLNLSHSKGVIDSLSTGGNNVINVITSNQSDSQITQTTISDNGNLSLIGQSQAILKGEIKLDGQAKGLINSSENANLKIDINPAPTSTLEIVLNGGIMEGMINQAQPTVGLMTLDSAGAFGGRWIATGDSAIKEFVITNSSANVGNEGLMLADTYTSPISLVDTTRDIGGISRVGMAMIKANTGAPQAGQTAERTIAMSTLDGINGVFRVYTDIGAEASDKITTQKASGSHIMQVYYNPATFTEDIANRYIVVAHVDDNQTTANFEGGSTIVGTQTYKTSLTKVPVANGGFDWILGKTQNAGANYGTKVISSILQSQYRSFAIQTETLRQRMGELRDINRVHGLWGRYTMGNTQTPESDVAIGIEDHFYSAWVGYDQNILDLKGQDFFGFALSYNLLNPQGEDYKGNVHSIGFNFYNTFIARNDFYVDLVIKYILSMANYEISYYSLAQNTPQYLNHKLMFNVEIGKKFKLSESKNYFFLHPEAQVIAGYMFGNEVDFIDFTQTTIASSTSGIAPVILRTGLSAGYSLNQGIKSDFYIGTSLLYETTNGGDVHLDDGNNTVDYSHKGAFKMSIQGGFDILFTDNARIYFQAGTSFFGKTNTTYSINAGARFAFGYKNTRKLIVPSLITPPPPQEPYDPRNIPVITDFTQEDIRNNNASKPKIRGNEDNYFINTRKAYRDKSTIQKTFRNQ